MGRDGMGWDGKGRDGMTTKTFSSDAVVGCKHVGKTSLINVLLAGGPGVLAEGFSVNEPFTQLLSYRAQAAQRRDASARLLSVDSPTEALRRYHVDVLVTPAVSWESTEEDLDRWLSTADVIVAVSDTHRQFEGKEEADFLQRFAAHKPILVLNNVDVLEGKEELERVTSSIDVRNGGPHIG